MRRSKQFQAVATQENSFLVVERATNTKVAMCMTSPYAGLEDSVELTEDILNAYDKYYKAIHTTDKS